MRDGPFFSSPSRLHAAGLSRSPSRVFLHTCWEGFSLLLAVRRHWSLVCAKFCIMQSFTTWILISLAEVLLTEVIAHVIDESMLQKLKGLNPQSNELTFKSPGSIFTADSGTLTALKSIQTSSSAVPNVLHILSSASRAEETIFSPLGINSPVKCFTGQNA